MRTRDRNLSDTSSLLKEGHTCWKQSNATRAALLELSGIGPWTAQYIELRALGWPDAFPAGDLGLRKALGGISTRECEERSQSWRPWRAYAAAHLWHGLSEQTP